MPVPSSGGRSRQGWGKTKIAESPSHMGGALNESIEWHNAIARVQDLLSMEDIMDQIRDWSVDGHGAPLPPPPWSTDTHGGGSSSSASPALGAFAASPSGDWRDVEDAACAAAARGPNTWQQPYRHNTATSAGSGSSPRTEPFSSYEAGQYLWRLRLTRSKSAQELQAGKHGESLRALHIPRHDRPRFQRYAHEMTRRLRVEFASANPYIQALRQHRNDIAMGESLSLDGQAADAIPVRLATEGARLAELTQLVDSPRFYSDFGCCTRERGTRCATVPPSRGYCSGGPRPHSPTSSLRSPPRGISNEDFGEVMRWMAVQNTEKLIPLVRVAPMGIGDRDGRQGVFPAMKRGRAGCCGGQRALGTPRTPCAPLTPHAQRIPYAKVPAEEEVLARGGPCSRSGEPTSCVGYDSIPQRLATQESGSLSTLDVGGNAACHGSANATITGVSRSPRSGASTAASSEEASTLRCHLGARGSELGDAPEAWHKSCFDQTALSPAGLAAFVEEALEDDRLRFLELIGHGGPLSDGGCALGEPVDPSRPPL